MKRIFLILLILTITLAYGVCGTGLCAYGEWQTQKSAHFIVYYRDAPLSFVKKVIDEAEDCYQKVTDRLGFTRFDFWLWERRAKIYIYNDSQEYQRRTDQPSWSGGCVSVRKKVIKTYAWAEGFFGTVLPHELGHIVFREFIGFKADVPLWLDEGVATLQEEASREGYLLITKRLVKKGVFIPLDRLSKIEKKELLIVPIVFYAEAASVVNYLLEDFGKAKFVSLCRDLRDGKSFEEAMSGIYHFRNLSELNDAWVEYLQK